MTEASPNTAEFEGRVYTLDAEGYLDPPEQWDESFARGMAVKVDILSELTDDHWRLIHYLRKKFAEERIVPLMVTACVETNLRLRRLRHLFPTGYHRGACKIAGLNYAFLAESNLWLTYENYSTLRTEYQLTDTGFLENFEDWDERFAEMVLHERTASGNLTDEHRGVIAFLRKRYRETRDIPTVYETCEANGIGLVELRALFSGGYRRGACRAAGLPFFA